MEVTKKEVVKSTYYYKDIQAIFEYGESTFGESAALGFFEEILSDVEKLTLQYLLHPECRHLETKTKKYRNIILGSYLIIYRITETRIEVLRAFHGSRSPKKIIKTKKIIIDYK
ncbi:type II toxin-antitoxin system RelE/ParE family toxin [Flavobacterium sp. GA093]|uniref:Type II toxin-antitoxin system RelE/ParE family toxin n=1 Tax=Flavobacterium hydrocarbonoxydans TaxID=2683249 RepID=A0A6I4NHL6_9FLAO|nr:type II toxin-antitoxin system RelE/ParE family toxin [Flavobacterium hydrocarbonoxydans]MWB93443.1 type II toxin-antitoxin system RelE/ParE family toxin [Flavobacterium hydrocarbonoxydans]